ncbi:FG-GAP repeat domain-containing protein [Microbacterium sp. NPDC089698]|uniref:FG-GAP repeat domain-containing protein n=1 Tax=Microbacterium sp. NPDC089698 TaxID=3364200 RepID=UPI00381904E5
MKRTVPPGSRKRSLLTLLAIALIATGSLLPATAASATTPQPGAQQLAQQILSSGRLYGEAEPMAQIQGYANGTVLSHNGLDCSIDSAILLALKKVVVDRGFTLRVSSLNRYCIGDTSGSSTTSYHYKNGGGHAIDIDQVNNTWSTGSTSQDIALIQAMFEVLPAPAGVGQAGCGSRSVSLPAGWTQFADTCNHNHFEYQGSGTVPLSTIYFDLNGDSKSDLLAIRNDGYLVEFFGNGAGGTQLTYPTGPGWDTSAAIVHGDYNCDGAGDLLQTRAGGGLYFYAGNYASVFTPTYIGAGWDSYSLLTGGVDFTGDGNPDLVARASNGNLYAYPGNCGGSFGAPIQIGTGWSAMTALVAGDFNGDGRGDLIARNAAGELWGYYGTPNGLGLVQQIGQNWNGFSTITGGGDYNGDGYADIIARNGSSQTLWLYSGTGSGGVNAGIQVGNGWGAYTLIS